MKIRIIQWCDTKEYTIEKKSWFGGWRRLENDLFAYTEYGIWEMKKNSFKTIVEALSFLVEFKNNGRDAFIKNEISPTILQFDLKDVDKILEQKRKEALNA